MDGRKQTSRTKNNACFPNLLNEYLPSDNVQSIEDAYRILQIPFAPASVNGFSMTGQNDGEHNVQRSARPNPLQENTRRQNANLYATPVSANAQSQFPGNVNAMRSGLNTPKTNGHANFYEVPANPSIQGFIQPSNSLNDFKGPNIPTHNQQFPAQNLAFSTQSLLGQQQWQPQTFSTGATRISNTQMIISPLPTYPNMLANSGLTELNQPVRNFGPVTQRSPSVHPPSPITASPRQRPQQQYRPSPQFANANLPMASPHGHPNPVQGATRMPTVRPQQFQRLPSSPLTTPSPQRTPSISQVPYNPTNNVDYIHSNSIIPNMYTNTQSPRPQNTPIASLVRPQIPSPMLQNARRPVKPSDSASQATVDNQRMQMLRAGILKSSGPQQTAQVGMNKPNTMVRGVGQPSSTGMGSNPLSISPAPSTPSTPVMHHPRPQLPSPIVYTNTVPGRTVQPQQPVYGYSSNVPSAQLQQYRPSTTQLPSPSTVGAEVTAQNLPAANAVQPNSAIKSTPTFQRASQQVAPERQSPISINAVPRSQYHPQQVPLQRQPSVPASGISRSHFQPQQQKPVAAPTRVNSSTPILINRPSNYRPPARFQQGPSERTPLALIEPNGEWSTYRVDQHGTRIPKSQRPPIGTYDPMKSFTTNEGYKVRDCSDPRDFHAPTPVEQHHVWTALGPTRNSFHELTGIKLEKQDMYCLSLGYNAAWDEIKRQAIGWIFSSYGPDGPPDTEVGSKRAVEEVVTEQFVPSRELPGYAVLEVKIGEKQVVGNTKPIEAAQKAHQRAKYFNKDGEMTFSPEKALFKLDRWYGLIDGYMFAPNWQGARKTNRMGLQVQNPDAFPCEQCRKSGRLCYGHKEDVDRKCTPCGMFKLTCSKEEVTEKPKPATGPEILFGTAMRSKLQRSALQRGKTAAPTIASTVAAAAKAGPLGVGKPQSTHRVPRRGGVVPKSWGQGQQSRR